MGAKPSPEMGGGCPNRGARETCILWVPAHPGPDFSQSWSACPISDWQVSTDLSFGVPTVYVSVLASTASVSLIGSRRWSLLESGEIEIKRPNI